MLLENLSLSHFLCTVACQPAGRFPAGNRVRERHLFAWIAFWMSSGSDPRICGCQPSPKLVADAIGKGAASDYVLHAWVVMPNHVHLLITPQVDVPALLRRLKGASARESNKLLGQTGRPFWQDESYDRLVRNTSEFERIKNYILQNPVRAGLARSIEDYPWSSISMPGELRSPWQAKACPTSEVLVDMLQLVQRASHRLTEYDGRAPLA